MARAAVPARGALTRALEQQRDYEHARAVQRTAAHWGYAGSAGIEWQAATDGLPTILNKGGSPLVALLCHYASTASDSKSPPTVLLVHGATAWRGTFLEPNGGLIAHLLPGFDVWTLDWRCSKVITDLWLSSTEPVPSQIKSMTLDCAAEQELPAAIRKINETSGKPALLGHCIGSALISIAMARGIIGPTAEHGPTAREIVLSTLGLFYRGGVDTWFRAQERIDSLDPWFLNFSKDDWKDPYDEIFKIWQQTPYPHCSVAFCRRISCLLGAPYRPNDIAYLHDAHGYGLSLQFGVMPTSMLNHCAENVRRGWSAKQGSPENDAGDLKSDMFQNARLTLITGDENQLWHRDSIDRMHEWLKREKVPCVQKRVFERFGHQDLWWSPLSSRPSGVYREVADALKPREISPRR